MAHGSRGPAEEAPFAPNVNEDGMTEYEFHPLAEQYPLLDGDDIKAMADDIKANGQRFPILLFEGKILDGRNRYIACKIAGIEPTFDAFPDAVDPADFVASANLHRRHLTASQKREAIARTLKADPAKSDRAIAAETKVDHKTVSAVREEMVSTGEIPQLEKTTGKDGKKRPASKPKKPEPWDEEATPETPDPSPNGKSPKPLRDAKGLPVPESLRPTWESLAEFDRLKRVLEQVERDISALAKGPGGEFLAENLQGAKNDTYTCDRVRKVLLLLKANRPWLSRCPECLGQKRKDSSKRCVSCKDLGWITADTYGRADMAGTRAIDRLVAEQGEAADE